MKWSEFEHRILNSTFIFLSQASGVALVMEMH